jgi:hypothetical protein
MNIIINCDCGANIDTSIDSNYDVLMLGEGGYHKEVECPSCGSKYRVRFMVDILCPSTKVKEEENE